MHVLLHYTYSSLVKDEFLDKDFGESSKSLSLRYKKDSLRCGKFCKTSPDEGLAASRGLRFGVPFSTSKLEKKEQYNLQNYFLKKYCHFFSANNTISYYFLLCYFILFILI